MKNSGSPGKKAFFPGGSFLLLTLPGKYTTFKE